MSIITKLGYAVKPVCLAAAVAALAIGPAQALDIRAATEVGAGGDLAILLEEFEKAAEAQGDDISVDVFTGGTLGTQRQLQEQLVLGTIEVIATASDIVELSDAFSIFDLPFLFTDPEHAHRAMDGKLGEQLNQSLIDAQGVRVIAFGELGFRHITNSVRPIESPDDLQGLKIRVPSNQLRIDAFTALGAAPTPIAYSELYSALQQGVVDGQENPLPTIRELSLWEVQDFVSMTYHVYTPGYILVNEAWWQELPDEARTRLAEAGRKAAEAQRARIAEVTAELQAMAEEGVMKFNSPDLEPFAEHTRSVWQTFEEAHGGELIEAVESLR